MALTATSHIASLGFRLWRMQRQQKRVTMPAPHTHADIEINYISHGWIRYFHGQRFYEVKAGAFAVFWAGIPHQLQDHGLDLQGIWITFPVTWLLGWQIPGRLPDALMAGELLADARGADEAQLEDWLKLYESGDADQRQVVRLELEARIRRQALNLPAAPKKSQAPSGGGAEQFVRMTELLGQRYQEPIGVQDVAEALNLHPKYCHTLFKKCCGMTLWNYLTGLRIAHAERLLLTTDQNVLQIALDAGFATSSAFYVAFKKQTGLTPAGFRKQHVKAGEKGIG